jgi:hypothetical protein
LKVLKVFLFADLNIKKCLRIPYEGIKMPATFRLVLAVCCRIILDKYGAKTIPKIRIG